VKVVLLSGGTGGAKLAAGFQDMLGEDLTVIANTGDDVEINGLYVSPDPDLVTYWLTGEIDAERGWGIKDDGFVVSDRLAVLGAPAWFRLTDRDLATCLYRSHFLAEGGRLTVAQAQIGRALGAKAAILPMADEPVRTRVLSLGEWRPLQEYLILARGEPAVDSVELEGIAEARPTDEVRTALRDCDLIVIGPSNPVISIGPILSVPGMREAIAESRAPVVAVSPFVGGEVLKGPTRIFMDTVGRPATAAGVASLYQGMLDGMLLDDGDGEDPAEPMLLRRASTLMDGREARVRVAREVLKLAAELGVQ
jgi:LPPG:FO 2-phospho-L-lactate transferase